QGAVERLPGDSQRATVDPQAIGNPQLPLDIFMRCHSGPRIAPDGREVESLALCLRSGLRRCLRLLVRPVVAVRLVAPASIPRQAEQSSWPDAAAAIDRLP